MPSHCSVFNLDGLIASDGNPVTTVMWRANRLADVLTKGIAARHRLPASAFALIKSAGKLVQHNAACLGIATFLANNHEEQLTFENGRATKQQEDS